MPESRRRVEEHPGLGLAAVAAVGVVVRADDDLVERKRCEQCVVDALDRLARRASRGRCRAGSSRRRARSRPLAAPRRPRSTPGRSSTSSTSRGGCGTPSRTIGRVRARRRGRGTLRAVPRQTRPARASLEQRAHRLAAAPRATSVRLLQPSAADPVGVEADDGDVALPAAVAAGVLVAGRRRVEPDGLDGEVGDLGDRDVVAGRDVERRVAARSPRCAVEHGVDDVVDVDVRLALRAVAEDLADESDRRAAGGRSRSRRRASGAGRRRCRSGTTRPAEPEHVAYEQISASPASLLAPYVEIGTSGRSPRRPRVSPRSP